MYPNQASDTAQGLLGRLSTLTFRHDADYGQLFTRNKINYNYSGHVREQDNLIFKHTQPRFTSQN